jgi:predicted lipoprotein
MTHRLSLALVLSMASGCVPWTVRPIEEPKALTELSPAAYVDSIWSSKLLPRVMESAVDARELLDALGASADEATKRYGHREGGGPSYFIVKGSGRVVNVDARSRAGLMLVDVAPFDGRPDVSVQIGPVLRGTSLRDATGIVQFTDFVNQLQFADVANELNARVMQALPAVVTDVRRRAVTFVGTAAGGTESPLIRELVPVRLEMEATR